MWNFRAIAGNSNETSRAIPRACGIPCMKKERERERERGREKGKRWNTRAQTRFIFYAARDKFTAGIFSTAPLYRLRGASFESQSSHEYRPAGNFFFQPSGLSLARGAF